MVLSRFGGANSLSMISFTPMIAEMRAVVVRPACLDEPKHATAKERARLNLLKKAANSEVHRRQKT